MGLITAMSLLCCLAAWAEPDPPVTKKANQNAAQNQTNIIRSGYPEGGVDQSRTPASAYPGEVQTRDYPTARPKTEKPGWGSNGYGIYRPHAANYNDGQYRGADANDNFFKTDFDPLGNPYHPIYNSRVPSTQPRPAGRGGSQPQPYQPVPGQGLNP